MSKSHTSGTQGDAELAQRLDK